METPPQAAVDPRDAKIAALEQQIADMDAAQQATVAVARKPNPVTGVAARVWHSLKAVLTSPSVVKQEKSLAVLILGRLIVTLGGSYAAAEAITRILRSLGWA